MMCQKGLKVMIFEKKFVNSLLFIGTVLVCYYILKLLISGGAWGLVLVTGILSLPCILLLHTNRPIWLGLLLGIFAFSGDRLSVPMFDAFTYYGILMLAFVGYFVLDSAVNKTKRLFYRKNTYYGMLLFWGGAILVRFFSDPPASARLSGTGGLSIAIGYVFAAAFFPMVYWVSGMVVDWRKTLRLALLLNIFSYLTVVVVPSFMFGGIGYGILRTVSGVFNRQSYLILGVALSWAASRSFGTRHRNTFLWVSAAIMITSLVSGTRSTPVQAVAIILCVAFVYNKFAKVFAVTVAIGITGGIMLLTVVPLQYLPAAAQRSVSAFMPSTSGQHSEYGEMGWESGFRERLYQYAWEEIKDNPFIGSGWSFKRSEILSAVAIAEFKEARWAKLAMTGSYHNTFLTLAAKNGVITAVVFLMAVVGLLSSLGFWLRRHSNGRIKFLGTAFLCFSTNYFLLMFTNGSAHEASATMAGLAVIAFLRDAEETGMISEETLWS